MVGEPQIVVETPVKHLLAHEFHAGPYLSFKPGEHKISVCLFLVLSERTTVLSDLVENIHVSIVLIIARKIIKNIAPSKYLFIPICFAELTLS